MNLRKPIRVVSQVELVTKTSMDFCLARREKAAWRAMPRRAAQSGGKQAEGAVSSKRSAAAKRRDVFPSVQPD
jgi:hypothetical protein